RVAHVPPVVEPGAHEIGRGPLELAKWIVGPSLRGFGERPQPPEPRIRIRHTLCRASDRLVASRRRTLCPDRVCRRTEPPEPWIVGIGDGPALEAQGMKCAQHLGDRLAGPSLNPGLCEELIGALVELGDGRHCFEWLLVGALEAVETL